MFKISSLIRTYCSGFVLLWGLRTHKMLQINRSEAITRGFTQVGAFILWLWFQKWIKWENGSNWKHHLKVLATLPTTTQKWLKLLPKSQISDNDSFLSVMQEDSRNPREAMDESMDPPSYLSSHPDSFPELSYSIQIGRGESLGAEAPVVVLG